LSLWTHSTEENSVKTYFFGRPGGVSRGSFSGLNLSFDVGDDAGAVRENEALALREMGAPSLYLPRQVHGAGVTVLGSMPGPGVTRGPEADAVVTGLANVALGVLTADCVPILLWDGKGKAVAAVHAGWRGLASGVIPRTIEELGDFGVLPSDLVARIGPAIGPCCYEVDASFAERFERDVEGGKADLSREEGRPAINLPLVAERQLISAGLPLGGILDFRRCTSCEKDLFFSHRRKKSPTGRQLSAVFLRG